MRQRERWIRITVWHGVPKNVEQHNDYLFLRHLKTSQIKKKLAWMKWGWMIAKW